MGTQLTKMARKWYERSYADELFPGVDRVIRGRNLIPGKKYRSEYDKNLAVKGGLGALALGAGSVAPSYAVAKAVRNNGGGRLSAALLGALTGGAGGALAGGAMNPFGKTLIDSAKRGAIGGGAVGAALGGLTGLLTDPTDLASTKKALERRYAEAYLGSVRA